MNLRIYVQVRNVDNEHVHFKRSIEWNSSLSFPFDSMTQNLLLLYKDLKVVVEYMVLPFNK